MRLPHRRQERAYFRALPLVYLMAPPTVTPEPLYYAGSAAGRRYTPVGGPRGLYLSEDPATPPLELRLATLQATGAVADVVADQHILTLAIEGSVSRVLDLTALAVQRALELTDHDLRADWEAEQQAALMTGTRPPITQLLAQAAHATGVVSAIRYRSARAPFGVNVVVFPDRLDASRGDFIRTVDKHGLFLQELPPPTAPPFTI